MMESRPRSVLAAFQEHLQLASTKCGSLMEQLNIVRKKVEGKEATMIDSDPVSNDFLENVSPKTVLETEGMNPLDHKDVHNKEQMAVGNAYVERSTGDTNCDVNKHLTIRKSSQHSEIIVNKEEVPFLNGNVSSNETERYLKFDGATKHKLSQEKLIKESEKISGKTSLHVTASKEKDPFDQDLSSDDDDESTLSSCTSSDDDGQGTTDKQNIYEELLKRLKDNEEKKNLNKNRSSSDNSSSSFQKSQKNNKSPKKNSSNSTVNEENFDKRNCDIENLDVGVEFFLPSSVTEKFQEMFYEESGEEEQHNSNKDKNMRVTFDDLIIGRPNKHSLTGEDNSTSQNRSLNENSAKSKASSNQSNQQVSNLKQNAKVKEKNCETASVRTKSEKVVKPNTAVNSSTLVNLKIHSPEMNLYKRLNGAPLRHEIKKNTAKKDIKAKKTTIGNTRLKAKHAIADPKLKVLPDKRSVVAFDNSKNIKNDAKPLKPLDNTEKDVLKGTAIKTQSIKNNICFDGSKNVHKKSGMEVIATNPQSKKVDETKLIDFVNLQRDVPGEMLKPKEAQQDKIVNSGLKNNISKRDKVDNLGNVKGKLNSDSKNLFSKKNHIIPAGEQSVPKEKPLQAGKNSIVKDKKPPIPRIDNFKKNNVRTTIAGKELPPKNNPVNEESPSTNMKSKNNKERVRPNTSVQLAQPKKEPNRYKTLTAKKDETLDIRNFQSIDRTSKTNKEPSESLRGRNHLARETIHSQSINEMKNHTTSFPFILGQSTSKTYNVRAAIQQTMSMIMRSPAETLRRSSFSEMLNASSKASTLKTSASYSSGRKVCPACVMRVDEEDNELDENPIDPWDTEYHSKRFIRCTCMPRNTVNFKTVMNQLLHETSSSFILPNESYQESEQENGEENRVNKALFRRNNNIYKLSKLLHTLLKIRDLLVT